MTAFVPLDTIDPTLVEALLDRAFGTDRHGRTAYKVRGAGAMLPHLSFAAVEDGTLIGSIQCWPVVHIGDDGATRPLVMVGPVAVEPGRQGDGIGRALMTLALEAADAAPGHPPLMLIGDPDYYGRFFGFTAGHTAAWRLPGPVERHRLLARGDAVPDEAGLLAPADTGP
ncbi:GCN5 family acetyltransferase [Sphingomonas sp. Leaf17]|uniref:GNAT family N-acetyltransferase n=1 Tax=Sphingomonas sp. Leaf17 TaxID=1735683 RepID=UPI0006F32B78|nr:N-acetyltransferase [Sphingomonas sp. Leaf17]KQM63394.1 GCN5 family acetyltransferase [Sphingomonas sp. Leaf17]